MTTVLRLLFLVLLPCVCLAQTVRVANHHHQPFAGWARTTVDTRPAHDAGVLPDGTRYVLGRRTGLDVWAVDVRLELAARELRTVDLAQAAATPVPALSLPGDPLAHFGGWATFGGVPMAIVGLGADGAGWALHLRSRAGRTFVCDAWIDWRPDEPWLATGEVLLTSSNPAVPDVLEVVPAGGLAFAFGDGMVFGSLIAQAGESFADGQGRAVPVVIAWTRHVPSVEAWLSTVPHAVALSTCAVGVERLWPQGNPMLPPGLDPTAWTRQRWPEALRRVRTWDAGVTGPNKNSSDTGAQQDQTFVAGECMAGVGPEKVAYLSALKLAARPNHHRRADGSPVDPMNKPNVMMWSGRPHAATHDLLGKARGITATEANGWSGPDNQHWLMNGLTVAARVTGSRALQAELSQQARIWLWSQSLPSEHPTWATSGTDASRAVGWVQLVACHLHQNLEDRALADRVAARAQARIREVYVPKLGPRDVWDVRRDDPRLGAGEWWAPWQQAVGAYGLDVASERWGVAEGRAVALAAAKHVLQEAWVQVDGTWLPRHSMPVAGGGVTHPGWVHFGMALSVAVVLKHEPQHEQARAIWQQVLATADQPGEVSWIPPEVVLP